MTDGSSRGDSLLDSLRGLVRTSVAIAQTRLAILASELEEQGACFARVSVYALVGFATGLIAAILAVVFIIVAAGEHRLIAIGVLFLAFLAISLWSLLTMKQLLASRPKLLSATLTELEKDKNALTGQHEVDR